MRSDAALIAQDLCVQRGHRTLLEGLNLHLEPGQLVQVMGPNGSGKTTLLHALAGVLEVQGSPVQRPSPVFLLAAAQGLRPELTVLQQAEELLGGAAPVNDDLRAAGLEHALHQPVHTLSDGQRSRLMLWVAHLRRDPLWLIDEPLNALDADAQHLLGQWLLEHLQRGGMAVVATHRDLRLALAEAGWPQAGSNTTSGQAHRWPECFAPDCLLGSTSTARAPTQALTAAPLEPPLGPGPRTSLPAQFARSLLREARLMKARPQDLVWPWAFHAALMLAYPLGQHQGLHDRGNELAGWAPSLLWTSALLTLLLSAHRLFEADAQHGVLRLWLALDEDLAPRMLAKQLSHWVVMGWPLAAAAWPIGVAYGLDGLSALKGAVALVFGTLAFTALLTLLAALTLMARQAQVLMGLLLLPMTVPLLIVGTAYHAGLAPDSVLWALAAASVFLVAATAPICARLVRWSQA